MKLIKWFTGLSMKTKIISTIVAGTIAVGAGVGIGIAVNNSKNDGESPSIICEHEWEWESATVTCSTDGYTIYKCSKCAQTKQEAESAYGCYDYDNDGYCNDCNSYIAITAKAEWISNRSISYQDDRNAYRFCFALKDEFENYIACDATVEMSIVNDLGETIYEGTKYVKTSDYGEWYNLYGEWLGTAVYIYDRELSLGLVDEGTFYYTVIAGDSRFSYSLEIDDLPTYTPTYNFGETWIVNGEWELTILSVDIHNDCELNTQYSTYALITYKYKNIGNTESPGFNFNKYDFKVYDSNDNLGK